MTLSLSFSLKRLLLASAFLLCLFAVLAKQSFAFTNISDTITTSRPSASTPVGTTSTATTDTQIAVNTLNSSRFLASDSARILRTSTGAQIASNLYVSTQSADLSTVFLGNQIGAFAQKGIDVLLMPITAMHTIQLKTAYTMALTDTLTLAFPTLLTGDANNPASASASTFQMNTFPLVNPSTIKIFDGATDVTSRFTITVVNPTAGNAPTITFSNLTTAPIPAGDVIKIYIGCTTATSGSCSAQSPSLINPTKTAALGNADSWKVHIAQSGTATDATTVSIATIESVTLRATVDPTLSFTIGGIASGQDVGLSNAGCSITGAGKQTNTGITSTANDVNLGTVQNTPNSPGAITNVSAQLLTVTTNAANGYAITATASSALMDPTTGFRFNTSAVTPAIFPDGATAVPAHFFGLHACGPEATAYTWIQGGGSGGTTCNLLAGSTASNCLWSWPTAATTPGGPMTIATTATGPIGSGTGIAGNGKTSVAYAAGSDATVPPGNYRAVITYTATPTF